MNNNVIFGLLILAGLNLCSCLKSNEAIQPGLKVGVSVAPINPEIGAFIAGDKQNRKFTGIHDSLFVKAVVFSHGSETISCTLD